MGEIVGSRRRAPDLDVRVWGGRLAGAEGFPFGAEADIGIRGGTVVAVGDLRSRAARETVDARGLYVSPGWIDLHVHLWRPDLTVDADRDAGIGHGVTTVVDAGPVGWRDVDRYLDEVVAPAQTRVLLFLNVSSDTAEIPIHGRRANLDAARTAQAVREQPEAIVGVKVMASRTHCGDLGTEPVRVAMEAARASASRVMCHVGHAPPALADVLSLLMPLGDRVIVTHAWHGKPGGILDAQGRPLPIVREADARGVRWDLGHGSASFAFATARAALEAGLRLDTISTDLHRNNLDGPVGDLATTMTKIWALGVPLEEVVAKVTAHAASAIGWETRLGRIAPGQVADLTLFRTVGSAAGAACTRGRQLTDAEGRTVPATRRIVPVGVVRRGAFRRIPAATLLGS